MSRIQNSIKRVNIDYIPAELREGKTWVILYYVLNPFTGKLAIKRNRVRPLTSVLERRKLAKRMISITNNRLDNGWNPFLEGKDIKGLSKLHEVLKTYITQIEVEYKDGNLSLDTKKTYNSRIKNFKEWLADNEQEELFCYEFNDDLIGDYLDYLRYTKEVSARTRDNYFTFLKTLSLWMLKKKYITSNPCETFSRINKKTEASRPYIPKNVREKIFDFWGIHNYQYLILSMVCYYCLVRRTELTKLKVRDLHQNKNTLFIEAEVAKNNKTAHVSVPSELMKALVKHVRNAKQDDYLFSASGFYPGTKKASPNVITNRWRSMRKKIDIDDTYKWYGLKDSGITDLIMQGVNLKSVRDQARHHSIKQTEEYMPRNMKFSDPNIINSGVTFLG